MRTKNPITALLITGLFLHSCNFAPKVPEGEYLINGTLKNIPDSTVILLLKEEGRMLKTIHKDIVLQGKFTFHDTISGTSPQKLLLLSNGKGFPGTWADIWIQSGKYIQITGQDHNLPLWEINSEVAEQQATNDFMSLSISERKRSLQLNIQEHDLFRAEKEHGINWRKIDSLRVLRNPLDSIICLAELNYMKEAPMTATWLKKYKLYCSFLQWNQKFGHQDLIRSLYTRMSETDKATEEGKEITAYLNLPKIVEAGDEMVDGDLYDLEGNIRHLAEFKGKYILLDFWSQGCAPCMESLPEMEEITTRYQDKMEVISISQDSKDSWKAFIAKRKLKGHQWNELRKGNTGLAAAYQAKGIPHYVMISPKGKILRIWSGYSKGSLNAKIKELIK